MAGDLNTLLDAESQQLEGEAVELQARINRDSDRRTALPAGAVRFRGPS